MDIKNYLPNTFYVPAKLLSRKADVKGAKQMLVDHGQEIFNIRIYSDGHIDFIFAYTSSCLFRTNFFKNDGTITGYFIPDLSGGGTVHLQKLNGEG